MLQVIESKDIRQGEPRWFCSSMEDAQACMKNMQVGDLHTDDAVAVDCVGQEFAIVDRPAPDARAVTLDELLHLHEDLGGYRDPRDPARIDPILGRLRAAWLAHPDLRLGQLLVGSIPICHLDRTDAIRRLYNAECAEFGVAGAPIEWVAASTDQPHLVLDFDEVERAIWSVEHAAEVRSGVTRSCNALRAALRPVIAEARAAVALRVDKAALVKHIDYNPSLRIRECAELRAEVTRLTAELAEMSARAREADAACEILGAANGETLIRAAQRVVADARMGAAEIAAASAVEAERNQLRNAILHLAMAVDVEAVKAENCAEGWRLLAVATLAEVRKLAAARAVPPDVEAAIIGLKEAACGFGIAQQRVIQADADGPSERASAATGMRSAVEVLKAAIARAISDATAGAVSDFIGGHAKRLCEAVGGVWSDESDSWATAVHHVLNHLRGGEDGTVIDGRASHPATVGELLVFLKNGKPFTSPRWPAGCVMRFDPPTGRLWLLDYNDPDGQRAGLTRYVMTERMFSPADVKADDYTAVVATPMMDHAWRHRPLTRGDLPRKGG